MKSNIIITTGGSGGHVVPPTILYEHLSEKTNVIITIDNRGLKYLDKRMINLDLMAKANIGLTYMDVPKGFNSRIVIPYDLSKNEISSISFIKHLSNKYSKFKNSWFGNFKVNEVIK